MGDVYLEEECLRRDVIAAFPNNRIVIFPQTLYFTSTLHGYTESVETQKVYSRHSSLTVIARDRSSYDKMKMMFPCNNVLLTPDIVMMTQLPTKKKRRSGVLLCLRSDSESILTPKERDTLVNLFKKGTTRRTDMSVDRVFLPEERAKAVKDKLSEYSSAELVITDRLHGMIFAAITDTPCVAIDNFNGKISAAAQWLLSLGYIRHASSTNEVVLAIEQVRKFERQTYNYTLFSSYLNLIVDSIENKGSKNAEVCTNRVEQKYNVNICNFARYSSSLSAVIVTNADRPERLISLLDSLRSFTDEMVVILDNKDPGIARLLATHTDKVKINYGKGAFEAYVGDLFQHCSKDWILRIDSDETLDNTWTRDMILHLTSDRLATHYWIPRKWYLSDNQYINVVPWFPDYQLRLFRNIPGIIKMPSMIHEPMEISGENRRIDGHYIEHWDLCLNNREKRERKVKHYNQIRPYNGSDIFYLYEDYPYDLITKHTDSILQQLGKPGAHFLLTRVDMPIQMKKGLTYATQIHLLNRCGPCLCPSSNIKPNLNRSIFVSYHWFNYDKSIYCWDYDRTALPDYLRPCEELDVLVPVATPFAPGEYFIQFDLVEEGVMWFAQTESMMDSQLIRVLILDQK